MASDNRRLRHVKTTTTANSIQANFGAFIAHNGIVPLCFGSYACASKENPAYE